MLTLLMDILSQILYDKTQDVGKILYFLKHKIIFCIVQWLGVSQIKDNGKKCELFYF